MIRLQYKDNFLLKFEFEDVDGIPVSMKGFEADFWISTRQTAPAFLATLRDRASKSAVVLDDGAVLVSVKHHHLPPGKVNAVVNVLAEQKFSHEQFHESHKPAHGHNHAPHDPMAHEQITLTPEVPLELIDNLAHTAFGRPDVPVVVKCRFNVKRQNLLQHVSKVEMQAYVQNVIDAQAADQKDIDSIVNIFNLTSTEVPEN